MGINERGSIEKQRTELEADTRTLSHYHQYNKETHTALQKKRERTMSMHIFLYYCTVSMNAAIPYTLHPYLELHTVTQHFYRIKASVFS